MSVITSEILGTALLIILGDGVVAAVLLNKSKAQNAGWIVITFGWGMAVTMAIYVAAKYSGAQLNPAVTTGLWIIGKSHGGIAWATAWRAYIGELIGAFLGAVIVFAAYLGHWRETEDPGLKLACFCTGPAIRNTPQNFITEFIGTFILMFGVLAITNPAAGNTPLAPGLGALAVGFLVFAIGLSLGGPTGYAINPARDLMPRIAHAVLPIEGKGGSDWEYAWIPVIAPLVGASVGALAFMWLYPGF
jgi:glycerol uptake facilitator protein